MNLANDLHTDDKEAEAYQPYVSKEPDERGFVHYNEQENTTWKMLYERQMEIIPNRACPEFLRGLDLLQLSQDAIPQLPDINAKLKPLNGWQIEKVPAVVGFERFFELLSSRRFPAATFIRRPEHHDYLQEPDIFHEIFGHCPLLTNQPYADFSQRYGELGLKASKTDRFKLARLYWFTIEFGLVRSGDDLKAYGGGILSSPEESKYALDSDIPTRTALDPVDVFRTHYRIDELQKHYFIIDSLDDLQTLINLDLDALIAQAKALKMKTSAYKAKEDIAC